MDIARLLGQALVFVSYSLVGHRWNHLNVQRQLVESYEEFSAILRAVGHPLDTHPHVQGMSNAKLLILGLDTLDIGHRWKLFNVQRQTLDFIRCESLEIAEATP